ncbi:MAG: nucleotide-binding protein [Gemmatimonas sp.]
MRRAIALLSVALLTVACSKGDSQSDKVPLGTAAQDTSQGAPMGDAVSGTLVEQIAAAPYVYLRLKTANGEVWAAVNEAKLTVGSPVTVYGAILMEKFESKTLNRTFDQIYFGSLEAPGAPSAMGGAGAAPASTGTPPAVDAKVGRIDKATGADARTIAELWSQKDAMAGKIVSIRGQVVKYNPGVMGKNWIHLQDGSGDAAKGTHDITVTSMAETSVGATITITGPVRTNKDFGAGYSYVLIVEDAKVVK